MTRPRRTPSRGTRRSPPPSRRAEASASPVPEVRRLLVPGAPDGADARRARRVRRPPDRRRPRHHAHVRHDVAQGPRLRRRPPRPPRAWRRAPPATPVLAVHAPFSLLQASLAAPAESRCRVVYLCRDPKDALVSFWHYIQKCTGSDAVAPFRDVFELFCGGVSPFGPAWDHMAEYWKESAARPEEVMFLRYKRLKEDTAGSVKRLAEFLGCPFTGEELAGGVPEAVVALCSMDRMRGVEANRNGEHGAGGTGRAFFRKGEVGDWKEHMTGEMARRLDGIVEKLRGSGLSLIRD